MIRYKQFKRKMKEKLTVNSWPLRATVQLLELPAVLSELVHLAPKIYEIIYQSMSHYFDGIFFIHIEQRLEFLNVVHLCPQNFLPVNKKRSLMYFIFIIQWPKTK